MNTREPGAEDEIPRPTLDAVRFFLAQDNGEALLPFTYVSGYIMR